MDDDYISISELNDFIFCPYSIYLHHVYMETDEDLYHATPQAMGSVAHYSTDKKMYSTRKNDICSIPVYSASLGVQGKIDLYKADEKLLIEKKYALKQIFRGQYYQLWAQYFCMIEMGYEVDCIAFYEISTKKMIYVSLPGIDERKELESFILQIRTYNPSMKIKTNINKCLHCVYCNLCDKTEEDNVYT